MEQNLVGVSYPCFISLEDLAARCSLYLEVLLVLHAQDAAFPCLPIHMSHLTTEVAHHRSSSLDESSLVPFTSILNIA